MPTAYCIYLAFLPPRLHADVLQQTFIQLPRGEAERVIEADQVEITTAIDRARATSQQKATELQQREGKPMSAGWGLTPMTRNEFSGPAL
jgi:hypothetical protein